MNARVLVLERVSELVGKDELVGGGQPPVLAHGVELFLARPLVVEAGHVLLEQTRPDGAQVGARIEETEGDERLLVRPRLRRRVLVVEDLLEVARQLCAGQVAQRHVGAERHAPDLGHLRLQLGTRDVLEAEQAAEQRVDEVARIDGRRLLRADGAGEEEGRQQHGRAAAHFTSTTSFASFRSKAPAGRRPLISTFSNRIVV